MNSASTELTRGGLPVSPQQDAIVEHGLLEPVTVVGAGAGSGKTHTTVATVVELVEQGRATPDQFVLITFTNKAADQLRAEIERALRARYQAAEASENETWHHHLERLGAAYVGTIHGFCRFLIRTYGFEADVARESDVTFATRFLEEALYDSLEAYTKAHQDRRLLAPGQDLEVHRLVKVLRAILEEARNRGFRPTDLLNQTEAQEGDPGYPYRVDVARLVADASRRYEAVKRREHRLDAHDLLERAAALLTGPHAAHVLPRVGARFRYLFVDEYQDTDATQTRIITALQPHLAGVLVVGDRKQSIYGWRGAEPGLLERFAAQHGTRVLPMNVSRRPTEPLLRVQNALFFDSIGETFPDLKERLEAAGNTYTPEPGLPPLLHLDADVHPKETVARAEEAAKLLDKLVGCAVQLKVDAPAEPLQYGHIVVLCRANWQVQTYAEVLQAAGVPARADTGSSPYTRPEIVATYRLLRTLLHYPDDTTLALALDTPYFRDVDALAERRRLVQLGPPEGETPLLDWLENTYPHHKKALKSLREAVRTDTVPQLLARLYDAFGLTEHYVEHGDLEAVQHIEQLRARARNLVNNEQALSLRAFVLWLQMAIESEREEREAELPGDDETVPPFIRVLTIHRAKGLQYPVVVVPEVQESLRKEYREPEFLLLDGHGLEVRLEGMGVRTTSARYDTELQAYRDRQVEEEMRVLYVALTRARHALITVGGRGDRAQPSSHEYYSWRDELIRARPALQGLGAQYGSLGDLLYVLGN